MSESFLRQQFPIFNLQNDEFPWLYFDNGATTQKPQSVIDTINQFYSQQNANVHRASHRVSAATTESFEQARKEVAAFINAASEKEIIWTKGTTESINLVATVLAKGHVSAGDEIVLTALEHHANIVPWQQIAIELGLRIRVIPVDEDGVLQLDKAKGLINNKTALVAIGHVSNALGNINPIAHIITLAKKHGALTLIDGAQAIAHLPVDVQALDCDFYVFSGHKIFGPTGIGVLYGRQVLLEGLPPYQTGGEMIEKVSFSGTTFQSLPFKFEAGTPNIAGVLGLGAAISFVRTYQCAMYEVEQTLYRVLVDGLKKIDGIRLWGDIDNSICVQSFSIAEVNNQDIGVLLNEHNIAVRVGHHCAMPLMQALGIDGTVRASLSCYNTLHEVQHFLQVLEGIVQTLRPHFRFNPISENSASKPFVSSHLDCAPISVSAVKDKKGRVDITTMPLALSIRQASSWDEIYRQIMLAGKQLNKLPSDDHIGQYEVMGCESQVWLKCEKQGNYLALSAYSPSKIVRGLLAIIFEPLTHLTIKQIKLFDLHAYLDDLGLGRHVSQSRGNGLQAVIEQIKVYVK
ncbi:SufS family cysteine desulfurase [uncultured Paraglaciecola sp.]|uniref:SufS family cysteine desulfurase n=1 Tax=uncultured Paraglaciecola sp. TaxID=1765024 RepID=UPI0030D99FDF|tara:strand:+ start:1572 stop:3293 length:1722 start_codon:yes stop_codon:yes gene_type:complete